MKIVAIIFAAVALAGCAGATAPGENVSKDGVLSAIKYVHDTDHQVGCWFYVGTDGHASLSCIPDLQYVVK